MNFFEIDKPLINAFLRRECDYYHWLEPTATAHRRAFIKKMRDQITSIMRMYAGADRVHIQSLSNMGLVNSSLTLSVDAYEPNSFLFLYLPPSPRGSVGQTFISNNRVMTKPVS